MNTNVNKPLKQHPICVKIMLYKGLYVDEVIYYRNKLPMSIVEKWRWYFEYLAARVKVKNPRRKVELIICVQDLLQGEEYKRKKIKDLLRAKRARLNHLLNTPCEKDLFCFHEEEREAKVATITNEIEKLENGKYNGYIPVEYINIIKKYI